MHLGEDLFGLGYVLSVLHTRLLHPELLHIDSGVSFAPTTSDHGIELIKSRRREHPVAEMLLRKLLVTFDIEASDSAVHQRSVLLSSIAVKRDLLQRMHTG